MKKSMTSRSLFSIILIIFLGIAFFGSGCEGRKGAGTDLTMEEGVEAVSPSMLDVVPANRSSIIKTKKIVVKFSSSMDPSTLVLDGNMASESDGGVWSSSESENDTLTISPSSSWTLGTRTLSISCNDSIGNPLSQTLELMYGVQVVYVKAGESGDGLSMDSPKGNINDAIGQAIAIWPIPSQVHVAFGVYEVNSEDSSYIVTEEGVSLLGGFSTEDWTARDPSTNVTTIRDICTTGGDLMAYEPTRAIESGANITEDTVIDGFKIQGGAGKFSSALYSYNNQGPTISNNIISTSAIYASISIFNKASSPKILNNTISSGTSSFAVSAGIANMLNCSPVISGNMIKGGNAAQTGGIMDVKSASEIYNNVIYGGQASDSSSGISLDDSSTKIYNNTINGSSAANNSRGIKILDNSHPYIINNIIFTSAGGGKRYGIYEMANTSDPAELKNNDVFDCPDALYHDFINGDLTVMDSEGCPLCCPSFSTTPAPGCNNLLTTPGGMSNVGNISMNPNFENADDWHLTAGSPVEVREGGLDLSADFQTDKDGNPRTVPWSMGAYEYD